MRTEAFRRPHPFCRFALKVKTSEHAAWCSGFYGRLIDACLAAAGAPADLVQLVHNYGMKPIVGGVYAGGFEIREANATYAQALASLTAYKPLGPAYIIAAGAAAGEGAVITKQFNASAERNGLPWNPTRDVWHLGGELATGSFYVLQTNYDRWKPPPEFDDRRYPGMNCLEAVGPAKLDAASVWGVLSSNPTRNALTTFSTVMSPGAGHFEAHSQNCAPGPDCAPF